MGNEKPRPATRQDHLQFYSGKGAAKELLAYVCNLQYPDAENLYYKSHEDDYSQLPDKELCLKLSASRQSGFR